MNSELVQVSDFVSILEIFLLLVVSYIGTIIHEYIFIPGKTKFIKNIRVWLTVIMNFIICYSINPYIVEINPRLILLPPLVLGLLGNELAVRLGTIKGSTSFIEYILGFFGIKNKLNKEERQNLGVEEHREIPKQIIKEEETEELKEEINTEKEKPNIQLNKKEIKKEKIIEETKTEEYNALTSGYPSDNEQSEEKENANSISMSKEVEEDLKQLNQTAYIILNDIDAMILEYYDEENKDNFVNAYLIIKPKIRQFSKDFKQYDYLPINTTLKISEILDKERDIDKLYRQLVQVSEDNNE